jgi:predicted phosphodiesterase
MRVSVISDIHLEMGDLELPGGDVLIMAGDIMESRNIRPELYDPENKLASLLSANSRGREDRYYRFMAEECAKYRQVIYVAGNHEHYKNDFNRSHEQLATILPDNIKFLQNQSFVLDGVLFLGATLWTDMNRGNPLTIEQARYSMNDYRTIRILDHNRGYAGKFTPEMTIREHIKSKDFFKSQLDQNRLAENLPVIVVGHHAPSRMSTHPRYQNDIHMNGSYSSDLSEFILDYPEIMAWHHGHTHDRFKYQIGNTWILCNPRGYYGYEENAIDYKPRGYTIDVVNKQLIDFDTWN